MVTSAKYKGRATFSRRPGATVALSVVSHEDRSRVCSLWPTNTVALYNVVLYALCLEFVLRLSATVTQKIPVRVGEGRQDGMISSLDVVSVYTNTVAGPSRRGRESSIAKITGKRLFPSAKGVFNHWSKLRSRNRLTVNYYGWKACTC